MFQIGEIIVCVNGEKEAKRLGLTIGKKYKVIRYLGKPFDPKFKVHIINDRNESQNYQVFRFVTLAEFRKKQILKIKEKCVK
jgi:hypothetical protein